MEDSAKLKEVLDNLNVEFSFSVNCISGFVGESKCNCWRCRTKRKEPVNESTNELAKKEADAAKEKEKELFVKSLEANNQVSSNESLPSGATHREKTDKKGKKTVERVRFSAIAATEPKKQKRSKKHAKRPSH